MIQIKARVSAKDKTFVNLKRAGWNDGIKNFASRGKTSAAGINAAVRSMVRRIVPKDISASKFAQAEMQLLANLYRSLRLPLGVVRISDFIPGHDLDVSFDTDTRIFHEEVLEGWASDLEAAAVDGTQRVASTSGELRVSYVDHPATPLLCFAHYGLNGEFVASSSTPYLGPAVKKQQEVPCEAAPGTRCGFLISTQSETLFFEVNGADVYSKLLFGLHALADPGATPAHHAYNFVQAVRSIYAKLKGLPDTVFLSVCGIRGVSTCFGPSLGMHFESFVAPAVSGDEERRLEFHQSDLCYVAVFNTLSRTFSVYYEVDRATESISLQLDTLTISKEAPSAPQRAQKLARFVLLPVSYPDSVTLRLDSGLVSNTLAEALTGSFPKSAFEIEVPAAVMKLSVEPVVRRFFSGAARMVSAEALALFAQLFLMRQELDIFGKSEIIARMARLLKHTRKVVSAEALALAIRVIIDNLDECVSDYSGDAAESMEEDLAWTISCLADAKYKKAAKGLYEIASAFCVLTGALLPTSLQKNASLFVNVGLRVDVSVMLAAQLASQREAPVLSRDFLLAAVDENSA